MQRIYNNQVFSKFKKIKNITNNSKGVKKGDIFFIEQRNQLNIIRQLPEVNGAIVVLNPHNGDILALSGGISFELSELSHKS